MGSIDCKGNRVLHGAYLLGEHPEQAAQLAVPASFHGWHRKQPICCGGTQNANEPLA